MTVDQRCRTPLLWRQRDVCPVQGEWARQQHRYEFLRWMRRFWWRKFVWERRAAQSGD